MARATIIFTTAPAGGGKSYRRGPHFLLTELLPDTNIVHWSNLPLNVDLLIDEAIRRTGFTEAELRPRLKLIPRDITDTWRDGSSGPWEYFKNESLDGVHLCIDEIHNFCSIRANKAQQKKWADWLGEIRHMGATIEFMTQSPGKVAKLIEDEAGQKLSLVNSETRRDPIFRILLGDWYQLRAKFITGKYQSCVWEYEYREADDKWEKQDSRLFYLDPNLFALYDSYSRPHAGGKAGTPEPHPFEIHNWRRLLWWFFRRNWFRVCSRGVVIVFLFWLIFLGGAKSLSKNYMGFFMNLGQRTTSMGGGGDSSPSGASVRVGGSGGASADSSAQVDALRSRVKVLEDEAKQLREQLGLFGVVRMISDNVVCIGASYYKVGELIDGGPYKGRRIMGINSERRQVNLDDFSVLTLGVLPPPGQAK